MALTEPSVRRAQDRAISRFFRLYLQPFHPYTTDLFERARLPANAVSSVEDLAKLPFLSKKDLLASPSAPDRFKKFILTPTPEALRRAWPFWRMIGVLAAKRKFRESFYPMLLTATTGRAAEPVSFIYARRDLDILSDAGRRLLDVFGLKYPDRVLSVFPYAPHLAFWQCCLAGFASDVFMVQSGGGKVMGTEGNLRMLDKLKPTTIVGVPSFVYHLLREALAAKLSLAQVRKVVLGAEKVPPGMKRKMISLLRESGAQDPLIFSTYAFTEAKKAWGECPTADPEVSSGYHLTPDLDLLQIADPVTGKILPPETPGEIVYTPLAGAGTLVYRYRTGDIAEGGITYRPCPHCGRDVPRLMGPISRVSNIKDLKLTKIKGTLVNLNNLAEILDDSEDLEEWQIEIRKKDNDPHEIDEVILYIAVRIGRPENEIAEKINRELRAACEITPNDTRILPLKEMVDRIRVETALKEVRILDLRPKT
ncbi:phenylacetate--CoA ligase family protein [bacterium]|nr:phenylacetate--CoA ligase family protein [bacterium]